MNRSFHKKIVGYNKTQVQEAFEKEKRGFEQMYSEYQSQLSQLMAENADLHSKIEELASNLHTNEKNKERIAETLAQAHLGNCRELLKKEKSLEKQFPFAGDTFNQRMDELSKTIDLFQCQMSDDHIPRNQKEKPQDPSKVS